MIHRIQTVVVTLTTIGVWSNLYINYLKYKDEIDKKNLSKNESKWDSRTK